MEIEDLNRTLDCWSVLMNETSVVSFAQLLQVISVLCESDFGRYKTVLSIGNVLHCDHKFMSLQLYW